MADLSKVKLNGIEYDIKDAIARAGLEQIKTSTVTITNTLSSGTRIATINGTDLYAPSEADIGNLSDRVAAIEQLEWVTYYSGRQNPSDSQGQNGDVYLQY